MLKPGFDTAESSLTWAEVWIRKPGTAVAGPAAATVAFAATCPCGRRNGRPTQRDGQRDRRQQP